MAWERIDYSRLESAASSISFASGLTGYKFFRITGFVKITSNNGFIQVVVNNDTASNYIEQYIAGSDTTVSGSRAASQAYIQGGFTITAGNYGSISLLLAKPSASLRAQSMHMSGTGAPAANILGLFGDEWNSAEAINRIDLVCGVDTFAAGTAVLLEGLAF